MRHFILAIALGLMPISLNAQTAAEPDPVSAARPEQDLDCAIFVAMAGANAEGSRQTGVIASMTYFIGRFEAVSDIEFKTAAAERLKLASMAEIVAKSDGCISRMEAFSVRMNEFGEAFKDMQSELDDEDSSDE
ncbi:MAG: hypothetical protein HKN60_00780 [Rhizobiales bacterium]|nr:hypothetical protein [Hyphomicrobiales bacterium]